MDTPPTTTTKQKNLTSASAGAAMLLVLSGIIGVGGLTALSEATLGVGMIAFALLLCVWARILQAAKQHDQAMRR